MGSYWMLMLLGLNSHCIVSEFGKRGIEDQCGRSISSVLLWTSQGPLKDNDAVEL